MTAQQLMDKIKRQKQEVETLKELFSAFFPPEFMPEDRQFHVWIQRYDFTIVGEAIEVTGEWYNMNLQRIEEKKKGNMTKLEEQAWQGMHFSRLNIVKYASGVMKHKAEV
jgi:hypothetical protein